MCIKTPATVFKDHLENSDGSHPKVFNLIAATMTLSGGS